MLAGFVGLVSPIIYTIGFFNNVLFVEPKTFLTWPAVVFVMGAGANPDNSGPVIFGYYALAFVMNAVIYVQAWRFLRKGTDAL